MLRAIFIAAGGQYDDWDEFDAVMVRERRLAVLVDPLRVYGNPGEPADATPQELSSLTSDGSVYKRQDGYWVGAFYTYTTSGARKRVVVYAKTLDEARDKLGQAQQSARSGIPVPDASWKLGPYLEYCLEHVVKRNRRPATYALYEINTLLYLVPGLGTRQLSRLSVSAVQMFLNQRLELGDSVRKVQIMRTVLSAALTRAVREELIPRNVARLVELPQWQRGMIQPWTADEAKRFLSVARTSRSTARSCC